MMSKRRRNSASKTSKMLSTMPGGVPMVSEALSPIVKPLKLQHRVAHKSEWHQGLLLSWDGETLYSASGNVVFAWDLASGKQIAQYIGHTGNIIQLIQSPDGKRIFTASDDKTVCVWDSASGQLLRTFEGIEYHRHSADRINVIALNRSGNRLLTGSTGSKFTIDEETIRIWDCESGRLLQSIAAGPVKALELTRDNRTLYAGFAGHVQCWDMPSGRAMGQFGGNTSLVDEFMLNSDETLLFTGSGHNVQCWDTRTLKPRHFFEIPPQLAGEKINFLNSFVLSTDGTTLFTASVDGVRMWDVASGSLLHRLDIDFNPQQLRVVNGGKTLLVINFDSGIHALDASTGKSLYTFAAKAGRAKDLAINTNGDTLFVKNEDHMTTGVWCLKTGRHLVDIYNVDDGFLWLTPADEISNTGWIWTNREELIGVYIAGKSNEILENGNPQRTTYIKQHNRQDIVMNRLNDFQQYRSILKNIQGKIDKHRLAYRVSQEILLLEKH